MLYPSSPDHVARPIEHQALAYLSYHELEAQPEAYRFSHAREESRDAGWAIDLKWLAPPKQGKRMEQTRETENVIAV